MTPAGALLHKHKAPQDVKRIFKHVHEKTERYELNLYVTGYEDQEEAAGEVEGVPSSSPPERSPNE